MLTCRRGGGGADGPGAGRRRGSQRPESRGQSEQADLRPPRTSFLGRGLPACDLPPSVGRSPLACQVSGHTYSLFPGPVTCHH